MGEEVAAHDLNYGRHLIRREPALSLWPLIIPQLYRWERALVCWPYAPNPHLFPDVLRQPAVFETAALIKSADYHFRAGYLLAKRASISRWLAADDRPPLIDRSLSLTVRSRS